MHLSFCASYQWSKLWSRNCQDFRHWRSPKCIIFKLPHFKHLKLINCQTRAFHITILKRFVLLYSIQTTKKYWKHSTYKTFSSNWRLSGAKEYLEKGKLCITRFFTRLKWDYALVSPARRNKQQLIMQRDLHVRPNMFLHTIDIEKCC